MEAREDSQAHGESEFSIVLEEDVDPLTLLGLRKIFAEYLHIPRLVLEIPPRLASSKQCSLQFDEEHYQPGSTVTGKLLFVPSGEHCAATFRLKCLVATNSQPKAKKSKQQKQPLLEELRASFGKEFTFATVLSGQYCQEWQGKRLQRQETSKGVMQFQFKLPENIPSSLLLKLKKTGRFQVSYFVEAQVEDTTCFREFIVRRKHDQGLKFLVANKMLVELKEFVCCLTRRLQLELMVQDTILGEGQPLQLTLEYKSAEGDSLDFQLAIGIEVWLRFKLRSELGLRGKFAKESLMQVLYVVAHLNLEDSTEGRKQVQLELGAGLPSAEENQLFETGYLVVLRPELSDSFSSILKESAKRLPLRFG